MPTQKCRSEVPDCEIKKWNMEVERQAKLMLDAVYPAEHHLSIRGG